MEVTVKKELSLFLSHQIPTESLSFIDDIVLDYIVSVLEQLGQDEQFDVDEFAEIMAAYIPGFDIVNREDVCSWMLGLAEKLLRARTTRSEMKDNKSSTENRDISVHPNISAKEHQTGSMSGGCTSLSSGKSPLSITGCKSTHDNTCKDKETTDNASDDKISILAEMFPDACSLEIEHCLAVTHGDAESAVQLMLLKGAENSYEDEGKENSPGSIDFSPKNLLKKEATASSLRQKMQAIEEEKPLKARKPKRQEIKKTDRDNLKEKMMARYGYIDVSQDEKTHQPVFHNQENKKLVRYRNNQVVSTKGERFSLEKQQESEEMKKTYVNLKPARKYRFH